MVAGFPKQVRVVEVGPRDGLQNEVAVLDTATKVEFIERLTRSGLREIEVTSFVQPRAVPQLADAESVYSGLPKRPDAVYRALVPNMRGLERAVAAGVTAIAVFTAASETFNARNIGCGIAASLKRFEPVLAEAGRRRMAVRGYVSCALGCPYEGRIDPGRVAELAAALCGMGCTEVALGDTVGVGTPASARRLVEVCSRAVPIERLALHLHDTRGQALANVLSCLELGVANVDAAVAGLGGCPYAEGASGNLATEDLLYMLEGLGIETGVELGRLIEVGRWISRRLGRENGSRVGRAGIASFGVV